MTATIDHHAPAGAPTDAQLVAASIERPDRFAALFDRHVDAIWRYVAARIGPDAADDVVSESFAIAFSRRERFDQSATSARPWIYGIATNRLMKHRDTERRWLRRGAAADIAGEETTGIDARLDAASLAPPLAAALLELSAAERDVVLLHAIEGLAHDEIASVLGIRRGAARTRLSRGLAKLRARMEDHDHA